MNPAAEPSNVERAVSRTLRDSLDRMQRTSKELDEAVADFVAACASNRPANALPSMLRAQTASASLTATLEVLSRFVTSSLQPGSLSASDRSETEAAEFESPSAAPEIASTFAPTTTSKFVPEMAQEPPVAAPESAPDAATWRDHHDKLLYAEPASAPEITESAASPLTDWAEVESQQESHDVPAQATEYAPAEYAQETESLTQEPPPDPALEQAPEAALSPEISARPDAMEPVATWEAPEQPEETIADNSGAEAYRDDEIVADGIVEDQEQVAEVSEATAAEESRIIEEAISAGLPKMPQVEAEPVEAEPVEAAASIAASEDQQTEAPVFDIAQLSDEERELHRRASRVAKVSMQDIRLLQPDLVVIGRENKDICIRLHEEIERAHKEYDRRFRPIMSHPVDYFYEWMVEILAAGDPSALGEYPYQSPSLRR